MDEWMAVDLFKAGTNCSLQSAIQVKSSLLPYVQIARFDVPVFIQSHFKHASRHGGMQAFAQSIKQVSRPGGVGPTAQVPR